MRAQNNVGAVLITRAEKQAVNDADMLQALGFETCLEPMLSIEDAVFTLPDLSRYRGFIFTSSNAIEVFAKATARRDLALFVVGNNSKERAAALGFRDVTSAEGDVEALAAVIAVRCEHDMGAPLLYVRGEDVSAPLATMLGTQGYSVDSVVVYRALQAENLRVQTCAALEAGEIGAVILSSKRTAQAFLNCIAKAELAHVLKGIKALCISESVVKYVRSRGWEGAYGAPSPDREGLVQLIQCHCIKRS